MKKTFLSVMLVVSMIFTVLPTTVFATQCSTADIDSVGKISAFNQLSDNFEKSYPFDGYTYNLSVEKGISVDNLNLPDKLVVITERTKADVALSKDNMKNSNERMTKDTATTHENEEEADNQEKTVVSENDIAFLSDTSQGGIEEGTYADTIHEEKTIAVSWKSNTDYNSEKNGVYIFIPELPEGYTLASNVNLPQINVMVGAHQLMATMPPSTAEVYGMDASNVTDYTIDGNTFTIKTAKGAAFWSANGKTYLDYTITLDADIDVSGFQWTPIGSNSKGSFKGTFDGQGHTISGMNFANNLQFTGLFVSVNRAVIKNLTVSGNVGVTEVSSNWIDKSAGFVGGIVCIVSDTTITNCHSELQITVDVTSPFSAGGIAAFVQDNVTIDGCSNSGTINVSGINLISVGGIAGDIEPITVSSSIKSCANTGELTIDTTGQMDIVHLGGIAGFKSGDERNKDIIVIVENCYNSGVLEANSSGIANVGGIAGNNYGNKQDRIINCYNVGKVTGKGVLAAVSSGIVGSNGKGSVYNSYWKTDTAATCVQYLGYICNCGTFDTTGTLTATTDENAGTTDSEHGLTYGDNLLTALNGWVDAQVKSSDYQTWVVKPGINNGYPIFGVESGDSTFDFCNGTPTVSTKPSSDPTWGTMGYTFAGWYTKPNGEGSKLIGEGDGGITYYAKWTIGAETNLKTVRTTALNLSSQTLDEDKLSTEGWAWYYNANPNLNYSKKTLILSGLILNTTDTTALNVPDGTTIVLATDTINTVKGGDITSDSKYVSVYGVYCLGILTIQGDGTLNATGGKATSSNAMGSSYGIYSITLKILGGTIAGVGGSDTGSSLGIFAMSTNISGGTVVGKGGSGAVYDSGGILGKFSLTITNGTVMGIGGTASCGYDYDASYGILSSYAKISGGTVNGTGGTASFGSSYGMDSAFELLISGGTVNCVGGNAHNSSYGICSISINDVSDDILTITGGTVTAQNAIAPNQAAICVINSTTKPNLSEILTIGSDMWPASITNATDGKTVISTNRGTIASNKLVMSGSNAVTISFPDNTVTFDANGGTVSPGSATIGTGGRFASLPTPTRSGRYSFDGWFTAVNGGEKVTTSTTFRANSTIYAHWNYLGGGGTGGSSYTPPANNNPQMVITVPVKVSVSSDSKGNCTMALTQEKLDEILNNAQNIATQQGVKENGIVAELEVNTPADTKSLTVEFPKVVQDTLVKENVVELKINSSVIEINFDKAAIGSIQSTASMDVQITAKPYAVSSPDAKAAIGDRPAFDLTMTYGDKIMSSFGKGKVYVGIPYIREKNEQVGNIAVVYVDERGKVTWLTQSSYDDSRKLAFFATDHFSAYGIAYNLDTPSFRDIEGHWAKDDILFVVNRGLFNGIGNDKFGSDLSVTRGMYVTVLGRLAQAEVNGYKNSSFSDISANAYYMAYVEWANKNSIVNGIGDRKYAPDAIVTREQLAVMMDKYAALIGFQLPTVYEENTFSDDGKIDSWAKDAVRRMQMAGIINGREGNFFDPKSDVTRAEASAVLKRFIELAIHSDTARIGKK